MNAAAKTVLVVDDAALVRVYYRSILEGAGFHVAEALNGLEALEALLSNIVDLLIVDINMPQMDGLSFIKLLRQKERPLASIPALVISAESAEADFAAARSAGANYYLVKPVERERLADLARMLCGLAP
ncbi:MAG TPA: response regulator [Steroidobacteraceae bacterium]|jgi:two-component system chemotaxis response regulator CheY|nr:response regulator [Steroidobacteraceae bacterium]